jgi:cytochrome c
MRAGHALLAAALCASLIGCGRDRPAMPDAGGNPARGRMLLREHDCGVCHVIPGVRAAHGRVGPSLTGFGRRVYIAGAWPNQPDVLVRFVRDAPSLAPHTLMPRFDISERDARDIAAYLYE